MLLSVLSVILLMFVCLFHLPVCPSVYLSVCLSLSVCQWICWRQVGDEIREVGQGSVRRKRQRDKTVYRVFLRGTAQLEEEGGGVGRENVVRGGVGGVRGGGKQRK